MLGRVDGVEVDLHGADGDHLTVFTPHAEQLEQARFVLISPKHPEIDAWASWRPWPVLELVGGYSAFLLSQEARLAVTTPAPPSATTTLFVGGGYTASLAHAA